MIQKVFSFAVIYGLLSAVIALSCPTPAQSQTNPSVIRAMNATQWITEQYPPFNFVDPHDNAIKGISVDILMQMFKKMDIDKQPNDLRVLPWARSYKMLQKDSDTALFSMVYTEERQDLFLFVGPILPIRVSLIAKKDRHLKITSLSDINKLKIGVTRDDAGHLLIQKLGVDPKALTIKANLDNLVQMLYRDRLDAVAYAEDIIRHQSQLSGLDPNECEPIYLLKESHMGYAFNRSANPEMLEALQKTLDQLHGDGTVERIKQQYLK